MGRSNSSMEGARTGGEGEATAASPMPAGASGEDPARYLPLDDRAARRFLDDWEPVVRRQLRRLGAEEDEVLTRVFERALNGLPAFRGESRLSTWLYRITYREGLRHLQRERRLRDREAPLELEGGGAGIGHGAGAISAGDDPEALLLRREEAGAVRRALAALDPRERELIALRYLDDLKLAEVADRLGWPLGTVKVRLHRALRRLRQELEHG
jgi:RNA polymerase sigma-70 factor (ECF subfamily)